MNDFFSFNTDSAILNRALEIPTNLFWTEKCSLDTFGRPLVVKTTLRRQTKLYVMNGVIKIKLATKRLHACTCSDLSNNESLTLSIAI